MRRKTFDAILTSAGALLTVALLISGSILLWGATFASSEVHNQLASQKIFFPPNNSPAIKAPEFAAMHQYAGEQLLTGAQAEVYADHFIANHLKEIGGGKTYAQLSTESRAQPNNAQLAAEVNLVFKGETLRGLLLESYGFWMMGQIALTASIAAYALAALSLLLTVLGILHLRRVSPTAQL